VTSRLTGVQTLGAPRLHISFVLISGPRFFFFFLSPSTALLVSGTFPLLHVLSFRLFLSHLLVRILLSLALSFFHFLRASLEGLYESSRVYFGCVLREPVSALHTFSRSSTSCTLSECLASRAFVSLYLPVVVASLLSYREVFWSHSVPALPSRYECLCCFVCALFGFGRRTIHLLFCECRPDTANESYRNMSNPVNRDAQLEAPRIPVGTGAFRVPGPVSSERLAHQAKRVLDSPSAQAPKRKKRGKKKHSNRARDSSSHRLKVTILSMAPMIRFPIRVSRLRF
jgi:hypothetical protein